MAKPAAQRQAEYKERHASEERLDILVPAGTKAKLKALADRHRVTIGAILDKLLTDAEAPTVSCADQARQLIEEVRQGPGKCKTDREVHKLTLEALLASFRAEDTGFTVKAKVDSQGRKVNTDAQRRYNSIRMAIRRQLEPKYSAGD
jgi:hypothetical protein